MPGTRAERAAHRARSPGNQQAHRCTTQTILTATQNSILESLVPHQPLYISENQSWKTTTMATTGIIQICIKHTELPSKAKGVSSAIVYLLPVSQLEKAMAPHSSTLAWKILWAEEPGRLQSMGSQSWTRLSDFTFTFHFHALEKEMATHSSVLAWRIPGTGELGGLPSMRSRRVGDD